MSVGPSVEWRRWLWGPVLAAAASKLGVDPKSLIHPNPWPVKEGNGVAELAGYTPEMACVVFVQAPGGPRQSAWLTHDEWAALKAIEPSRGLCLP